MAIETFIQTLPIRQWAEDDRPREKLQRKGHAALSDAELLAILIGSGNHHGSALDLAKQILRLSGNNLNELARLTPAQLQKIKGIGNVKALTICASLELGRRRNREEVIERNQFITSRDCFELFHPLLSDLPHEEFWVLLLNRNNRMIAYKRVSEGGVGGTVVDPKIVFKLALDHLATSLVLCHNHPSQNRNPSNTDIQLTHQLKHAGNALDIHITDHLIIAGNSYFSFLDESIL